MIYLDHNATTPIDQTVLSKMLPYLSEKFANPSSVYAISQTNKTAINTAREKILNILGGANGKLIFTGGGSEADNLAIKGFAFANQHKGKHIITSAIEHHAVLSTCEYLESRFGFRITYLPVNNHGLIKLEQLKKALTPDTILISIMHANNETGIIQPLKKISEIAKAHNITLHTDAVQTAGKIPIDINELGVDLLTISAHKFYGPKGVGALYIKKGLKLDPQIHGGGQESHLRAGTENIAGIIGMAEALTLAKTEMEKESTREKQMRDALESLIEKNIPEIIINGKTAERTPNTLSVVVKFVEGEGLLLKLERQGILASSGSACTSGSLDPSHVMTAMGIPVEFAHGSIRFSFGKSNQPSDIKKIYEGFKGAIEELRAMSPLWES